MKAQRAIRVVPGHLVFLFHPREYRGGEGWIQQRRYVISKLHKTASFIVVESLDVPPEHTHVYIQTAALILPKESCG